MRTALRVLITTFIAHNRQDTMLRVAAINKLAKMGHTADIESLRIPARKASGVELKAALEAISAISERRGSPDVRGGLRDDPATGPLLAKDNLTPNERSALIEAVLQQGTIKSVSQSGGTNWNEVYFVTFEETLPEGGRRIPIEGVFKPESPGDHTKKRAFFSREIAAYQLDKLAGTGSVVPTMETIASMEGEAPRIGCIQYKLPNCRELGKSDDRFVVNDDFRRFIKSDVAKKDLAKIRLISYVLGDTDHFANMREHSPIYNYNNFLVSLDDRNGPMHIVPIDWGCSLGVPNTLVLKGILPTSASQETLQRLQKLTPKEAQKASGQYIDDRDSFDVGARIDYATKRLNRKK